MLLVAYLELDRFSGLERKKKKKTKTIAAFKTWL